MSPLYWMLRSFDWKSVHDVSGQPIGPICKGQAVHDLDSSKTGPTGCPETSVTQLPIKAV